MSLRTVLLGLVLALSACASLPRPALPAFTADQTGPAATTLLNELSRVGSLSPEQRRRELAVLEGERRLDDSKRFQLAALLERDDSPEALERSLKVLGAIENVDARGQALVELMKRALKARIELKQQAARAQELQDKLDQIKALEKSLQQRSAPGKPR
jgi:hypothetical protein